MRGRRGRGSGTPSGSTHLRGGARQHAGQGSVRWPRGESPRGEDDGESGLERGGGQARCAVERIRFGADGDGARHRGNGPDGHARLRTVKQCLWPDRMRFVPAAAGTVARAARTL